MIARLKALLGIEITDDNTSDIFISRGITVPTDGTAGYGIGCLFQHTDGGDGSALYVNEGTTSSCDFNLVTVAAA